LLRLLPFASTVSSPLIAPTAAESLTTRALLALLLLSRVVFALRFARRCDARRIVSVLIVHRL
jgi:hypothetical protein